MRLQSLQQHPRIIGALMMREVITRYGREGLGFLWLVGEPLIFALGVLLMWSIIKPPYEHGVRLGPFVVSGYLCLLMLRHQISQAINALQANMGLMYHERIHPLHILISRAALEFCGATIAFFLCYIVIMMLGQSGPPKDFGLVYMGWTMVTLQSIGLAYIFTGLAMRYDVFEKLTAFLGYALIPLSGAFVMAAWLPPRVRDAYLLIPFPHGVEMVRAGVFGEFVETHYDLGYGMAWAGFLLFAGLLLIATGRDRLESE
jgi:capsular polysaccharide transport system permease protein